MGYSPMVLLDYLRKGWTPKNENAYFQYGGHMIVTMDNINTFQQQLVDMTMAWKASLETVVLNPPK
jgi:hypothetical protein